MFETAHSLDKGDTRVTMGGTLNPETETSLAGGSFLGIVDHGLAEKTDVRVRLERRVETEEFGIPYSYLEVGTKWSFKNNWAFSLPLSFYFVEGGGSMRFLNPRFMFSQRISEKHEFTGVFHTKVGTVDGGFGFIPGAAIGFAVGNDIDVKALRLEAGYNAMNQITFGLGWQFFKQTAIQQASTRPRAIRGMTLFPVGVQKINQVARKFRVSVAGFK